MKAETVITLFIIFKAGTSITKQKEKNLGKERLSTCLNSFHFSQG